MFRRGGLLQVLPISASFTGRGAPIWILPRGLALDEVTAPFLEVSRFHNHCFQSTGQTVAAQP